MTKEEKKEKEMDKIVDEVTDCASEVYKTLGAGYDEKIYQEAMAVEFRKRNLNYGIERDVEVFYKEEKVGTHRLDFIVKDALIVELKAATKIAKSHIAQTTSYLRTLEMQKGLLINFPYPQADKPEINVVLSKRKI